MITDPPANPNVGKAGAAFNAPAAATYALGVVTSAALAANSVIRPSAKLQCRYS